MIFLTDSTSDLVNQGENTDLLGTMHEVDEDEVDEETEDETDAPIDIVPKPVSTTKLLVI